MRRNSIQQVTTLEVNPNNTSTQVKSDLASLLMAEDPTDSMMMDIMSPI